MPSIISGTSNERIIRTILLMILANGFAIAFLWDGYVGYARENARQLLESLGTANEALPTINPKVTEAGIGRLLEQIAADGDTQVVTERLGSPSLKHGSDEYYVGAGGYLHLQIQADRITQSGWIRGPHSEQDQAFQRWIGFTLGLVGLVLILQFLRVMTTRVSVTEKGLVIGNGDPIPFNAINGLRVERPGRVALDCTVADHARQVRLDSYVIKEFAAIVAVICERSGFPNPLAAERKDSDQE